MLPKLPKLAVVLALSCSIGLHWGLFQSLAWLGMVVNYSQDATLKEALVKTFDGKHPCALCKEIAKSKHTDKKSEFPVQAKKFEFLTAHARFIFTAPTHWWLLGATDDRLKSVGFTPPTPPPRGALV